MSKKLTTLEEVKKQFKGKGGTNPESESILVDNGADKAEGYVTLWSNRAEASKIVERCGDAIRKFDATEDGCYLTIDRKAFRGLQYAFRTIKAGKSKKSEATSARMKAYWENKKKES